MSINRNLFPRASFLARIADINLDEREKITAPKSELLANYWDMLLRETALSKRFRLKDVLFILKYVDSKDIFMLYY